MGFLEKLSGGRTFAEMLLILKENDPASILQRLEEYGLIRTINPNLVFTQDRRNLFEKIRNILSWYRLLYLEDRYDQWLIYFLGLLDGLSEKKVEGICTDLALGGKNRRRIDEARRTGRRALRILHQTGGRKGRLKASEVYNMLEPLPTEAKLFLMAKTDDENVKRHISLYFTSLKNVRTALRGKDLIAMGFEPGPLFRKIMNDLLAAKLDQKIKSKEDEVTFVRRCYGAGSKSGDACPPSAEVFNGHHSKRARRLKQGAADG